MATLTQLAQEGGRTERASVNVPKASSFNAATAGGGSENLAGELLSLGANLAKPIKEANDLSVYAAKRTAAKNKAAASKDLLYIQSQKTPETDLAQVQKDNENVFHKYASVKFSNQDAQDAYDDSLSLVLGESVARQNTILEIENRKKIATNVFNATSEDFGWANQLDTPASPKDFTEAAGVMSKTLYYTVEQSQVELVRQLNTGFLTNQEDMTGLLRSVNFDATKGVTQKNKDDIFKNVYGSVGTRTNGKIEWNEGLTEGAKASVLRTWSSFDKSTSSDVTDMNFLNARSILSRALSQSRTGEMTVEDMLKQYEYQKSLYLTFLPNTMSKKIYANYENDALQYGKRYTKHSLLTSN